MSFRDVLVWKIITSWARRSKRYCCVTTSFQFLSTSSPRWVSSHSFNLIRAVTCRPWYHTHSEQTWLVIGMPAWHLCILGFKGTLGHEHPSKHGSDQLWCPQGLENGQQAPEYWMLLQWGSQSSPQSWRETLLSSCQQFQSWNNLGRSQSNLGPLV